MTWKCVSAAASTPEALQKSWWSHVFHQDSHRAMPIANVSSPASRGRGPASCPDIPGVNLGLSLQPAPNSRPTPPSPALPSDNHVREATPRVH